MATDNKPNMIPGWFRVCIGDGLQRLYALRLDGTPAAETITLTAQAWAESLWQCGIAWDQEQDPPRLEAAFNAVARNALRWPGPALLRQHLPSRARPGAKRLPDPRHTPDRRRANVARVRSIVNMAIKRND